MDCRTAYMNIIRKAFSENRHRSSHYYEKHHILPKSIFPLWAKRKSNLVLLTLREHFICHKLLVEIYNCPEMWNALFFMANKTKVCSSRDYERIKQNYISTHIMKSENMKKVMSEHTKKWYETDEHRRQQSERTRNFAKNNPDRVREINNKKKLLRWWTDGTISIQSYEPPSDLFHKGRALKPSGKKWFNNGAVNKFLAECPEGFVPGKIGNEFHWWNNGFNEIYSKERPNGYTEGHLKSDLKKFGAKNIGKKSNNKTVICLETGDVFESISDAAKKYKCDPHNITKCCVGLKSTSAGFHWNFLTK